MPIYEYICQDCERHFEALVMNARAPECPACHGARLTQQLSVFAVGASAPKASGGCGACGDPRGPGACSLD